MMAASSPFRGRCPPDRGRPRGPRGPRFCFPRPIPGLRNCCDGTTRAVRLEPIGSSPVRPAPLSFGAACRTRAYPSYSKPTPSSLLYSANSAAVMCIRATPALSARATSVGNANTATAIISVNTIVFILAHRQSVCWTLGTALLRHRDERTVGPQTGVRPQPPSFSIRCLPYAGRVHGLSLPTPH
jgi:hypothetical protein